jgi:MoxR-like ATPase
MSTKQDLQGTMEMFDRLHDAIESVIVGHRGIVETALIALLCEGNVLIEGVPGLGKTLLVRTLANALGLKFSRIQFTPDLMPADIIGTDILTEEDGRRRFTFSAGPLFANVILADEINRATPKTQSALLEAMQERTVTVRATTYPLEEPYIVLATQNPIEMEGTYPLPEAQVDRFMLKAVITYPTAEELTEITLRNTEGPGMSLPKPVATRDDVLTARRIVRDVPVADSLRAYAVRLVQASRPSDPSAPARVRDFVEYGASPRAAISLILAAKAHALLAGEPNVRPVDIEAMLEPAVVHRLLLNFRGEAEGLTPAELLADIRKEISV